MADEDGKVDVFTCVESLRKNRPHMVQTQDQYKFIYLVLLEALTFGDTSISLKDFGQCMRIMAEKDTYTLSNGFSKEYEGTSPLLTL
ncbi:receptor-type tyrosine-protein phosphatase epsilon-like [Chiloscyllium plagiosum]|uniref:receptor-type tyrosine-protein phosphatase epsilon-like n=1 Tax=Chiloscyllium plagiosum TaxID=36176 RepID=UPI001CB884CC|nr:receptor-type tyrosine-protein phosphatase epsilon-like [Chiloscyllium plagiosum]